MSQFPHLRRRYQAALRRLGKGCNGCARGNLRREFARLLRKQQA